MIKAEIILDSVSDSGARVTTFVLTYPRFIHAEFMTHRAISRNASSSRAIPVQKFIDAVLKEPAMPIAFTKNCKGMQAKEEIENQSDAETLWLQARDEMVKIVEELVQLGVHKQHANRLLEPFQHISVVATATDWANFFALRTHKDAQPEFQQLATKMYEAYKTSVPNHTRVGQWHLPFIKDVDLVDVLNDSSYADGETMIQRLIKISVARCARVSYNMHDGTDSSYSKDEELFERLVGSSPIHASPTEHQAMAAEDGNLKSGNFTGWVQFRKTLQNENITKFGDSNE